MNYLVKIYRRYVYGVMGTLLFHIFLIAAFLLAEVDMKGNIKEEPLVIEFPDILPEEEKIPEEIKQETVAAENETANNLTNTASNKLAEKNTTTSKDKFFDDDYLKEVNDAKNLVSDVNNQLAKEKIKIEDIKIVVNGAVSFIFVSFLIKIDSVDKHHKTARHSIVLLLN